MATVLIVDDEAQVREVLRRMVEAHGHSVLEAGDGVEALEKLGEHGVDLAIVDLMMPRMDGLELMGRMRADHADTKVIVISGYDDVIDFAERERDVVMTLRKPFELNDVADALRVAFGDN